MPAEQIHTRFRAYQLGSAGSFFSYYAAGKFTLIEARVGDVSRPNLIAELEVCGKDTIDTLHITSWDQDHCAVGSLQEILDMYKPARVEFPGYEPLSDTGKECSAMIAAYKAKAAERGRSVSCVCVNPGYIKGLLTAKELGYNDILYWPKWFSSENANDNSTVKVFRGGNFNVASLGDVEDINVGAYLRRCGMFKREIDVLILAHHGADCPTNSEKFFQIVKPKVAVCSSNYDNHFEHPRPVVRDRLSKLGIPLFTTKTGDVIIESLPPHDSSFRVYNLEADSSRVSSVQTFGTKKFHFLSMNLDTLRNIYRPKPSYRNIK